MGKKKSEMNIWQKMGYYTLLGVAKAVGYLPYCVLYYVLAPFVYFVCYHLIRYRRKVVDNNLLLAFPEKSDKERRTIARKFYRHLAEVFVDVIDMTSMSRKELQRRMQVENMAETDAVIGSNNWIAALAHYGEWEYFSVYSIEHPYHNIGVYHPLSNKVMDRFMLYIRRRFGMEVAPMNSLARPVVKNIKGKEQMALGLIADQRPRWVDSDQTWRKFLGQPSIFFGGICNYAKKFGMMVYALDIDKVKPSCYKCNFVQIYDGKEDVDEAVIMDRYVAQIECMIRRRPELWLWSHKRWKYRPKETVTMRDCQGGFEEYIPNAEN